jgi:hypothetical protein
MTMSSNITGKQKGQQFVFKTMGKITNKAYETIKASAYASAFMNSILMFARSYRLRQHLQQNRHKPPFHSPTPHLMASRLLQLQE